MRNSLSVAGAAVGMLALAPAPAGAEEGMWTFDNFPTARMHEAMGWSPDQAWLDRALAGTARLPGCSGSNVSGEGLILTNQHCVIACLQMLSSTQANYLNDGFYARNREAELRCPGMFVQVLSSVEDVTARIEAATAGASPETFARRRDAEIARIERLCSVGGDTCEVVTLYQGGRYALHRYKRYDDVRIVFAPEYAMAAFGAGTDNFNFPRYCLDAAFLRVYENGVPAATPAHLSMRFTPVSDGELTLAVGNPGATSRLQTMAELAFERDVALPWRLQVGAEASRRLAAYAAMSPEHARLSATSLQTVQNNYAALLGRQAALANAEGMAHVAADEADLQARVARNRASIRAVSGAWEEISAAQRAHAQLFFGYQYLEAHAGERSNLFVWGRDIVRYARERQRPDGERMPRYTDARIAPVARFVTAQRSTETSLEEVNLALWLEGLQLSLGREEAARVLGGEEPAALARRLAQSRLADPAFRRELWEGGAGAVASSSDPMIVFIRSWDDTARAVRERYIAEVEAPTARAHERIARARFQSFGLAQYPDATFSPRISYGRVEGWREGERDTPAFTNVAGLFARASDAPTFRLSQRWLDARGRLNGDAIYNLVSSHDVTSGSSGSALLDQEGRVVGALFDGNMHSLGGEYYYDGALNRSVSVAATAIEAALASVYGMDALLAELRAP